MTELFKRAYREANDFVNYNLDEIFDRENNDRDTHIDIYYNEEAEDWEVDFSDCLDPYEMEEDGYRYIDSLDAIDDDDYIEYKENGEAREELENWLRTYPY